MLFNSYFFILLFLPLTLVGYYGLNHAGMRRPALAFLTGMSLWFCAGSGIYNLILLLVSATVSYGIAVFITRAGNRSQKLLGLWTGILFHVGALFLFKYYNFVIGNVNNIFHTNLPFLELLLPLGISFYTFQQISFLVDSFRGECGKCSFGTYLLYVSFFPKFTQGPITHHSRLIPQLQDPGRGRVSFENLSRGIYAFALGLAKKVLIADVLAKIVTIGYGNIGDLNSISAFVVMLSYSLQIYFDFSGYCDMAYGIGYMLNIRLPLNFNSPYKAVSISDFWDRWHITLTDFFTRYLYFPLGGSRRGRARTCLNIMIVFLVSGLWHGANWTFILWGMMHGVAKVLERIFKNVFLKVPKPVKISVTFLFVTFAWSLFRAASVKDALLLWTRLFEGGPGPLYPPMIEKLQDLAEIRFLHMIPGSLLTDHAWVLPAGFISLSLLSCFTMKNTQEKTEHLILNNRTLLVTAILLFWSILSLSEISEFLYFYF